MVVAFLIGPAARYLSGERARLTEAERNQMTVTERIEALSSARHTLIQAATGLVVIGGVAFTALGLWYTARTVETAQESQITDRYTKAVEQLGSAKEDVRLGGIYALQRLAADSPRDKETIRNVLAAFVRNRDFCIAPTGQVRLSKACTVTDRQALVAIPLSRPGADVYAALTIAPTFAKQATDSNILIAGLADYSWVRFPRADLLGAYLPDTNLRGAHLNGADLRYANLSNAYIPNADLRVADLRLADLRESDLRGTDLGGADLRLANLANADLREANLRDGYLSGADLSGAYLSNANLVGVDLRGAYLDGAYVGGADLRGADLRDIHGITGQQIRTVAFVDSTTQF